MARVKRMRRKGSEAVLNNVRVQRGLDRQRHFESGGTLTDWMGGPRTKTKNKKAWENKRRARQKVVIHG